MREAISNWVPGPEPRSCSINLDPSQFPPRCAATEVGTLPATATVIRAGNEGPRRFHNHGEGPY